MHLRDFELLLAGASIALSVVIALLVMRDRRTNPTVRWVVVGLAAAGAAYTLLLCPLGDPWSDPARLLLRVLSAPGVVLLWLAVRLLFDDTFSSTGLVPALLIAVAIAAALPVLPGADASVRWNAFVTLGLISAALVVHMLWILIVQYRDDLDGHRRALRLLLAGAGSVCVLVAFAAPLLGVRATNALAPGIALLSAQSLFKLCWLMLTVTTPGPLVRAFEATHRREPTVQRRLPAPATVSQAERILAAMETQYLYRQNGLSIAELAKRLSLPEHRLRYLINRKLGFRNFNSFLNHFRLREVAARLSDPREAHRPVLTLALAAGYGSIGPFNRAFRQAYGVTPTAFRRDPGAEPLADS